MLSKFIEKTGEGYHKVYDSIVVDPKHLDVLGNKLTQEIIKKLAKNNLCAMDISRELKEHEQKIYYHLRRLEKAGIIKVASTEKRSGMIAKMYTVVSPVVSTKLYDGGHIVDNLESHALDPKMGKFFEPFIKDGILNSTLIVGDSSPHGKYDRGARDSIYAADFLLMLGNLLKDFNFPHFQVDVEVKEKNLVEENLILIGEPRSNTILERINEHLPVTFEMSPVWSVKSKLKAKRYDSSRTGIILKCANPFNKNKKIIVIGGLGPKGIRAASIAITQNFEKIALDADNDGNVSHIVEGLDKDGNGIVDSVRFLE